MTGATNATAEPASVLGALALELAPGTAPRQAALAQAPAAALAQSIAVDLATLAPEASALDLVLGAAHFDPAELLRPGWPLHRRLEELRERAPRADEPRIIVFGANANGTVPQPMRAELELHGGPLRVLPFALIGDADVARAVAARFEDTLLERGMASAATALQAQDEFGARIEHARYLTAHDLAAMIAMQYDHVGLKRLWPSIETALLAPQREAWLDASPEPLLRYADGRVRMAKFDFEAWRRFDAIESARVAAGEAVDDDARRRYTYFQARQRQYRVVLEAHGIEVESIECGAKQDPRERLC
ncbi:MAG: hypothetical protein E6Q50_01940 [Lysobacter sp.]|nr:MAG: hypothetical protein E6Q50_01940 [Lysobacter sp.]